MRVVICAALIASAAFGQGFTGSLRGRVVDPNGASVPIAKISITDQATQLKRSTLTTAEGEYSFAAVTPATYTVTAEADGFKRMDRAGVIVSTQTAITADFALELGQVNELVNVTAESPAIETADASTGQVIDRQKMIDLPNLGRNPFMLSKLSETVVQVGNPKFNRMQDQSGSSQISIAGGPVRGNNYTLDGISITDSTNRAVIIPSVEAVQEMKVQANTYDAEMGRTGGGTFNTFLRSGSNDWHGSAFGYIRETGWVANNFFSNRAGQAKPDQPFKNYGGSIGGPVFIPKIYDGRNRTFFFATGEAYRQYDAAGTRLAVPTALERVGDFSQSLSRAAGATGLQIMYDPLSTTSAGIRTPFANNVIPTDRLSQSGLAFASYYPLPNVSTNIYGANNYDATVSAFNRADQTTWKADHEFFPWFKMSASYLHYGSREPGNRWFENLASPNSRVIHRKVDATQANATLTPQPTMVVAVRWEFNRFPNFTTPISNGFDLTKLGLPQYLVSATQYPAFPAITMSTDMANYGGGVTNQNVFYSRAFNATMSKFMGKHSIKTGFDFRGIHDDGAPGVGPSAFTFSDVFTRANPRTTVNGTGGSLATMLLGYPTAGSMTLGNNFYNTVNYYGFFVQDDWRITPKLTLNFGFRVEHESGVTDKNDALMTGFDPYAASPLQQTVADPKLFGTILYAGVGGNGRNTFSPMGAKLGPRFGFAYSKDSKTAIRGGYGIFWAPLVFNFQSAIGYSQQTPVVASFDNNFTPAATLENPYPTGLLQPVGNSAGGLAGIGQAITMPDRDTRSGGYVQQFSLDVQRETVSGIVLTAGFIGSRSIGLTQNGRNINQLDPAYFALGAASLNQSLPNPMFGKGGVLSVGGANITRSQLLSPFPQFTSVTLDSSDTNNARYTSAYVRAQRRFSQGLSLLASFTWSRNMDMSYGSTANFLAGTAAGPQNAYNTHDEWGLSAQDMPKRFTTAVTYELPFGKGKPMLAGSKMLDYAVGGWSVNVVGIVQSGYPLSITQPNNNSVIGASYQRPNATGVPMEMDLPFAQRIDKWINPAAFTQAPQYTFGNVSRTTTLRGPGQINWDLSIFKTFSVTEKLKAQFRAEALNVSNTPLFGVPNTTFTNAQFGQITTQANYPRLVQLGVRFIL